MPLVLVGVVIPVIVVVIVYCSANMSVIEEIQVELKKLHQEKASCEDVIHFANLIKQHGKSLDESEYNGMFFL